MLTIGIDSVTLLEVTCQTIEVVTTLHLDQDYTNDEPSGYLAMYFSNLTSFEQSRVDVIWL